jgi:hypothetical protein
MPRDLLATCRAVKGRRVGLLTVVAAVLCGTGAAGARAAAPSVQTARGCYLVGQTVRFGGVGFAPNRTFDVALDGVDFGRATTDGAGAFQAHLAPGGLPAGVAQVIERLDVTDGSREASTAFTLTRPAGARFLAARGNPGTLRAPFQVWGFSLTGVGRTVYLHYVSPHGTLAATVRLGRTTGQCGYLLTSPKRIFPFTPSTGRWTLQVDTQPTYTPHPRGPIARISVRIARS